MGTAASGNAGVGTIKVVTGDVKIIGVDGVARQAQVGDKVFAKETIQTNANAIVQVQLENGRMLDLGRDSKIALDDDVLNIGQGPSTAPAAAATTDIAALQAQIAAGADPSKVAEATAAGGAPGAGGTADGSGGTAVYVDQANSTGDVTSGYNTGIGGIGFPTLDPGVLPVISDVPLISVSVNVQVQVQVDTGTSGGSGGGSPGIVEPVQGFPDDPDRDGVVISGNVASLIEGTSFEATAENDATGVTRTVVFVIKLDQVFDKDVTVTYTISGVTATAGGDFVPTDGLYVKTVTIPAGQTEIQVPIDIVQDHIDEPDLYEYFTITLSNPINATINPDASMAEARIYDDDLPPNALNDSNWVREDVREGGEGAIGVTHGNVLQNVSHNGAPDQLLRGDVKDTDNNTTEIITVTNAGIYTGTYGTLVLNANGGYTYTLANSNGTVQALDDGETVVDTFNYTITDGYNPQPTPATLAITIFGTNDAPIVNADTNWAREESSQTASGNVLSSVAHTGAPTGTFADVADTDVDDALTVANAGTYTGTYGTLVLNANGGYTYTLANSNGTVQALDDGETVVDTFNYTATDGQVPTASTLAITIFGTNDAPIVNADTNWAREESSQTASGNVLSSVAHTGAPTGTFADVADTDVDDALTVANAGTYTGTYGTLVLNANGGYTYTLANSNGTVQALDDGETVVDTFNYTATDGQVPTASTLAITIFGTNDAPIVNADTNWAREESSQTASGNVLSSVAHTGAPTGTFADVADTDVDDALTVANAGTYTGTYGTLVLNANGGYTYTLANSNGTVQALDDGETVVDTFNYTATDGQVPTASTLAITIFGTNDAPIVNADTNWAREESSQTASGNVLSSVAHTGAPTGTFADVADTDVDDALTVANAGTYTGTYGTLVLNANGGYTYTLANSNGTVQALDDGETVVDTFNYTATDGQVPTASTLAITIFGTNDAPIVNADTNWAREESSQTASGNVLSSVAHTGAPTGTFADVADTDVDDALTVANAGTYTGTYGTLVLNANGGYTYTLANSNGTVQALDDGETVVDTFNYTATDGQVPTASTLAITIFGTNDAPIVNADTNWAREESSQTASGNVLSSVAHTGAPTGTFADVADTDVDDALTVANAGTYTGTYGTLVLNANGGYTYTLANSNGTVQALDDGETVVDTFNYTATDGQVPTASTLAITIFGTNDAPIVNADTNWAREESSQTASGNVLSSVAHTGAPTGTFADVADTDVDDALTVANAGTYTGTYGTLVLNANGGYTYTLANSNGTVQALDDGETVVDTFNYTATDGQVPTASTLAITIFGTNDAPIVNADTNWAREESSQTASGNVLSSVAHTGAPTGTFADVADTDVDDALTVANAGTYTGTYGTLVLNANGGYTYTLANSNGTVQALDDGETVVDTFNYTATDGQVPTASTLAITIFGTNDAPIVNADTNWAREESSQTASGNVLSSVAHTGAPTGTFADVADTDVDDALTVANAGTYTGTYGTLVLNANGGYTYTLANSNGTVQALDDGETVVDTFNYTATDGQVPTASTLAITIFGTNDAPIVNADTNWAREESSQTASGNVLSSVAHTGAPTGTFADVADTDVDDALTVANAGTYTGTYGTLVLNANGGYTYTLANSNGTVQALDDGETVVDTFNYTATDGQVPTASTLAITIFGTNDAPQVGTGSTRVSEEGLAGGIPDTTGSSDTTNVATITGSITYSDVDVETPTVTLTGPAGLTSHTVGITWTGTGTLADPLIGKAGLVTIMTVTITSVTTSAINYQVVLSGPIDHSGINVEDDKQLIFGVHVNDGTVTTNSTLTVTIEDDSPSRISPETIFVEDKGVVGTTDQVVANLNFLSGADGVGSVKFNAADISANLTSDALTAGANTSAVAAKDAAGNNLLVGGQQLYLYLSADGTTLTASTGTTAGGTVGFTLSLNGGLGNYTFNPEAVITNGTEVSSSQVQTIGGGNTAWLVLQNIGGTTQDAFISTKSGATVNTNNGEFGISSGQDFDPTEGYRIDFLNGVTFTGGGSPTFAITGPYNLTNAFRQIVSKTGTGGADLAQITVAAIISNEFDTTGQNSSSLFYSDANDEKIDLTTADIKVYDGNGNQTTAGITLIDNGNTITIQGLQQGWTFEINSSTQFNAVQIDNTGTTEFKLGVFSYGSEFVGTQIDLNYNVVATDADGDAIAGQLGITLTRDASTTTGDNLTGTVGDDVLIGTSANSTLSGGDGNDVLAGNSGNDSLTGGNGNDILIGGAGNDTMTGSAGSDTFKWNNGDQGSGAVPTDTVTDFNTAAVASGGDVLNLKDLLVLENHAVGNGNLGSFLSFAQTGSDVTLTVHSQGTAGPVDQTIVLQNTNMTALAGANTADSAGVIANLLSQGKLITD